MKKIFSFIILLCVFFVYDNVYAANSIDLIPSNEVYSVDMDHFYYSDVSFSPDSKSFKINQVKNKNDKASYLGVSILLFDENSVNIGFISYCTGKDLDGEYAQFRANPGALSPLAIDVKDRYFVGDHGVYDVAYYALLDDNYSCRSIDSNKYEGLTIEEIREGKVSSNYNDNTLWLSDLFKKIDFNTFITFLVIAIIAYIIIGLIVSLLYVEMYKKGLFLCFIPIVNVIVGIRLAFGYILCIIYTLLLILAIALFIMNSNFILLIILGVIYVICLIVLVYKKVTDKYRLFYVEDAISRAIMKKKNGLDSNEDLGNQTLDLSFEDKMDDKLEVDLNVKVDSEGNIISSPATNNLEPSNVGDVADSNGASVDVGNVAIDLSIPTGNEEKDDDPWAF